MNSITVVQLCCIFFFNFICLFLAALGLCCCVWVFSSCIERGYALAAVCRLLIAAAPLAVELRP